jgi:hypothetical protein
LPGDGSGQALKFFPEGLYLPLGPPERLNQRAAAAALADEVDEVHILSFFRREFGLLEAFAKGT